MQQFQISSKEKVFQKLTLIPAVAEMFLEKFLKHSHTHTCSISFMTHISRVTKQRLTDQKSED